MSQLKLSSLANQAGTEETPIADVIHGSARAWVNFNGTGVVAIRAAYSVSGITDNGVGDFTIVFATAMPDANYSVSGATASSGVGGNATLGIRDVGTYLTSSVRLNIYTTSNVLADAAIIGVSVFR